MSSYVHFTDEEMETQATSVVAKELVAERDGEGWEKGCVCRVHAYATTAAQPTLGGLAVLWDIQDASLHHRHAPQGISITPSISFLLTSHSHLARPPLICPTLRAGELAPALSRSHPASF